MEIIRLPDVVGMKMPSWIRLMVIAPWPKTTHAISWSTRERVKHISSAGPPGTAETIFTLYILASCYLDRCGAQGGVHRQRAMKSCNNAYAFYRRGPYPAEDSPLKSGGSSRTVSTTAANSSPATWTYGAAPTTSGWTSRGRASRLATASSKQLRAESRNAHRFMSLAEACETLSE